MVTNTQVLKLHREHPEWTAPDIAAAIGSGAAYVRATARRKQISLPTSSRYIKSEVRILGERAIALGLSVHDLELAALTKAK